MKFYATAMGSELAWRFKAKCTNVAALIFLFLLFLLFTQKSLAISLDEENIVMDVPSGSKRISGTVSEYSSVYKYKVLSSEEAMVNGLLVQKIVMRKDVNDSLKYLKSELKPEEDDCDGTWSSYRPLLEDSSRFSVSRECSKEHGDTKKIIKYQGSALLNGKVNNFLVSIIWYPPKSEAAGWKKVPADLKAETQRYIESVRICGSESELSCQQVMNSFLENRLRKSFDNNI